MVHDETVSCVAFFLFLRQKCNPQLSLYLQVKEIEHL